jgi:succinoglycan biosynthesis protein ExoA
MSGTDRRFPNELRSAPAGAASLRPGPPPTETTWKGRELPIVSILMPVRNEAVFIGTSLGAVLAQDYPHDRLEVLVADGMSSDATRGTIAGVAACVPEISVKVLDNPRGIVATGLNEALRHAKGKVLVRVDGHTVIAADYVRECVEALERSDAANVGGGMVAVGQGTFGRAVALATSSRFGVGGARFHYSMEEEWVDTVYMGCWQRETFERIGGFDEELIRNQDDEFNYRLRARGGKILLSPRIKSLYFNRSTVRSLWRQYFQYGYWKVRVMQKHPRQMRWRQFAPPLLVAALLFGLAFSPFSAWGWRWLGAVAVSYALALALASFGAARRAEWNLAPLLAVAFVTLHLAYGSGFLVGLVRFWNRWGLPESGSGGERPAMEDSTPV